MIRGAAVINYLCPNIEFAINGDDFDSIVWVNLDKAPITKKQYEDGFAKYESWKTKNDADKATVKQAILDRIGLTADELKTILG
jgi:hypothetical protein